jgi:hypothetical protein
MITKRLEYGERRILADGQILVREDTIVEEDGVELSRTYHRFVLDPARDGTAALPPDLKSVAEAVWTPAVVAARQAAVQRAVADLQRPGGANG